MSKGKLKNIHPFLIRARFNPNTDHWFWEQCYRDYLQKRKKEKRKGGRKEKRAGN